MTDRLLAKQQMAIPANRREDESGHPPLPQMVAQQRERLRGDADWCPCDRDWTACASVGQCEGKK